MAGPAFIELWFDVDGDRETFERVLTIDMDEEDSSLIASMLDVTSGQGRGYARVRRPDNKTIEVSFPPLMLKKGISTYRWYVNADSGESGLCALEQPCIDRAQEEGSIKHRL